MRRGIASLAFVASVACTGGEPPAYDARHLEYLVLEEPPLGTVSSESDPELDLEDVADNSDERRERFASAGFVAAYQATFTSTSVESRFQGFLLTSRAYLFTDPEAGLAAIRETIESEGSGIIEQGPPFLDRPGFTLRGTLDSGLPPGVVLAWQKQNVILVLAAVAVSAVSEAELREIARQIDTLEPPAARPE